MQLKKLRIITVFSSCVYCSIKVIVLVFAWFSILHTDSDIFSGDVWFVPLITQILDMSVMELLVTSYLDGPSQLAVCFQGVHLSMCPTKINSVLMFLNHFLRYTPKIKEGKKFWELSLVGKSTTSCWTGHYILFEFVGLSTALTVFPWYSGSLSCQKPIISIIVIATVIIIQQLHRRFYIINSLWMVQFIVPWKVCRLGDGTKSFLSLKAPAKQQLNFGWDFLVFSCTLVQQKSRQQISRNGISWVLWWIFLTYYYYCLSLPYIEKNKLMLSAL
mgnify:CR=1 FL=1